MRWTRIALLLFGAGLLLGLVVVAFELDPLGRIASWMMALGIGAIPAGILADWRRRTKPPAPPSVRRAGGPQPPQAPFAPRRAKARPGQAIAPQSIIPGDRGRRRRR
jgi:drug/metabolite transporter (DMT)-like permease